MSSPNTDDFTDFIFHKVV